MFTRDQSEHSVAQEFQALIVRAIGRLPMRAVRERAIEFLGPLEMVAENRFEFRALLWCHGAITAMPTSTEQALLRPASWRPRPLFCNGPATRRAAVRTSRTHLRIPKSV